MKRTNYYYSYLLNRFLEKHCFTTKENISLKRAEKGNKWISTNKRGKHTIDNFFPLYKAIKEEMLKNTFSYEGVSGYVGLVSLLDAEIEEIIPIDKVYSGFSHHSRFLTRGGFERVENGESSLFVVINKKVSPYYDAKIPLDILKKIETKITIL